MEPLEGWPLDHVLVGVATVRTLRELFTQAVGPNGYTVRAWDLGLCTGVSPQGSANSLERLRRAGLVRAYPSPPGCAPRYGFVDHPLLDPLGRLFAAELRASAELVPPHLRPDPHPDPRRGGSGAADRR